MNKRRPVLSVVKHDLEVVTTKNIREKQLLPTSAADCPEACWALARDRMGVNLVYKVMPIRGIGTGSVPQCRSGMVLRLSFDYHSIVIRISFDYHTIVHICVYIVCMLSVLHVYLYT